MSKSNETPSAPAGDDSHLATNAAAGAPDFEESVRRFWEKNRAALLAAAVVVLLLIAGRFGWSMMQEGKAASAREAYAAVTTDAQRETFAKNEAGTLLAGAALLEVADTAYSEGRYGEAIKHYDAAAKEMAGTVFADRIRLGRGMAQIRSGDESGGRETLRALANDTGASAAVRGEAAFHLASMAAAAGNADEVAALATQISSIDQMSTWSQRVMMLQATMGSAAKSDAAPAAGADVAFPAP